MHDSQNVAHQVKKMSCVGFLAWSLLSTSIIMCPDDAVSWSSLCLLSTDTLRHDPLFWALNNTLYCSLISSLIRTCPQWPLVTIKLLKWHQMMSGFCLNIFLTFSGNWKCVIQCIGSVDLIARNFTFLCAFYLQLKFSFTCLLLNEANDLFVMLLF